MNGIVLLPIFFLFLLSAIYFMIYFLMSRKIFCVYVFFPVAYFVVFLVFFTLVFILFTKIYCVLCMDYQLIINYLNLVVLNISYANNTRTSFPQFIFHRLSIGSTRPLREFHCTNYAVNVICANFAHYLHHL